MPTAEMQRHFGFTTETGIKPSNPLCHRHENLPLTLANYFENVETQTKSWECLWLDMGGEG